MIMMMMTIMQEKYEWWWIYMCDAKRKQLLAGPLQICTLGDRDEVLASHSNDCVPFPFVSRHFANSTLKSTAR